MIELLCNRCGDLGLDNWRIDAEVIAARDGYTNQSVMLCGPDGEAVALSRQSYGGVWVSGGWSAPCWELRKASQWRHFRESGNPF